MRAWMALVALLLFATLGCKGDPGPQGPQGPPGPAGDAGPPGPTVSRDQLPCPTGMVDIGATCIDSVELPAGPAPFLSAIGFCASRNRRLCTYIEWYRACKDLQAQVMNMTDNPEWVGEVYPDGDGGILGLRVGDGSCEAAQPTRETLSSAFRCCL